MAAILAPRAERPVRSDWVRRFAPRLWTLDFPRPMMGALDAEPDRLEITLEFQRRSDLAGLIWWSEDRASHPLLAYATQRDYRGLVLGFRWRSDAGVMPLDAVHGPTLTIEGRDAQGRPRAWYVRLWNYADGTATDAAIRLDFDALAGGWSLPGEADPVWAGDIDRMFVSMVPPAFDGTDVPLAAPVVGRVTLEDWRVDGDAAVLPIGDPWLPEHDIRMTSGYDDSYHQPPQRLVEQWRALGYRGAVVHYVGMSHFFALRWSGAEERFLVDPERALCAPARAWHGAFCRAAAGAGFAPIFSLSYELFAAHAPQPWVQRNLAGAPGLTGWEPPSALLVPLHPQAMDWLGAAAAAFTRLLHDAGLEPRFQVGEPWWWVGLEGTPQALQPCFYDAFTRSAHVAERGAQPPALADVREAVGAEAIAFLDWLGDRLARSTAAVVAAARAAVPAPVRSYLLFFAPQVLDRRAPELWRANMPVGWASPAFDVLQLEDYDYVTDDDEEGLVRAAEAVGTRLGYPPADQEYFAGFVLNPEDAHRQWPLIGAALVRARRRRIAQRYVWAWPQVARDGFLPDPADLARPGQEDDVQAFHDVRFPLALGFEAVGGPRFQTDVVELASGHEVRNARWASGLVSYDAGLGLRAEPDLARLLHFFRARRGRAHGFRLTDPLDHSSAPDGVSEPAPDDQWLGDGDGHRLTFPLLKRYGEASDSELRPITRPWAASVMVAVGGALQQDGWALEEGAVRFESAPPAGQAVSAGFRFDVPVRFDSDRLELSLSRWRAGEAPSVPMTEIREPATGGLA